MAEGTTVNCEPCGYNGLSKPAQVWCNDCSQGFCDECVNGHRMTKSLQNHHLISITDFLKSKELFVEENCEHHKDPYEFFCSQHDTILCLKCVQENHSKCKICKLSEVAKGSKTSTALTNLENDIQNTSKNIAKYQEEDDKSKTDLKQQEQNIRYEVYNIRRKLIKQLDQIQENLLKELELKYNNCTKKINENNSTHNKLNGNKTKSLQDRISNMKKYASEKQVFIGIRQIGNLLYKQNEEARKFFSKRKTLSLEIKTNDNAQSLLSDTKLFGEIVVRENSETCKFTDTLKNQAQLNIQKGDSLDRIKMQLRHSIKIKNPSSQTISLTACAILPTKQVVFADNRNNRLIFHTEDGSFSGDIKLNGIFDLAPIGGSNIAVVTDEKVKIVDVNKKMVERTITECGKKVWGICYGNGKLYALDNGNIKIVDLHGAVSKSIPIEIRGTWNITVHNNQIYFISMRTKTVYAIDHFGNQLWKFHNIRLQQPKCFHNNNSVSLDADNHGNVFIVLPDYHQVVVISSDGLRHRVILDKSNNLKGPSGVSYCRETDQLLVCNVSDGGAFIYDIK